MRRLLLLFSLLAVPPALAQAPAASPDPVVARVGAEEIRLSHLRAALQELPEELRNAPEAMLLPVLLDQMIATRALIAAARAEGLADSPEVRARVRAAEEEALQEALIRRELAPFLTEEALRERYRREVLEAPREEEVSARHILVPTEAEARAILIEARRPGVDFADLARRRSTGPGAREGGDLGFFRRGDMIAEFAEAAFALQPGQISEQPVRTRFGWHIIKVEARRPVEPPSFEQARAEIRARVFEESVGRIVERYRNAATVERFNLDGTPLRVRSPLESAEPPAPRR
ncbi:MAG: peptidylprolyl isomerase [Acetobacteraceae bacterium]|nr:peptidylprolyl isomerase [Acetobacteraceae bacterium]MDW8398627.1 peptidylprolyl isomerase [Acetobacteraceae bacterium]